MINKKINNKHMTALGLLIGIPATVIGMEAFSTVESHAETSSTAIDWIQANWLNYPSAVGKWNVTTVNGKSALGSTVNSSTWTGYLNTHAVDTTDAEFSFKMYQNETGDNDNMGWTFRHTHTGAYTNFSNHSFYVFVSNGGGAIPSGIYKKTVGQSGTKSSLSATDMTKLASISHTRGKKKEYNVKIDVKDEANGTRIKAYIDGVLVADVLDTNNPLTNGGYGPFAYSQAKAYFYDIDVNGASFLNVPPETSVVTDVSNDVKLYTGERITVSGTAIDTDKSGGLTTYYKFDNDTPIELASSTGGTTTFNKEIVIPEDLPYGKHTLYIYSKDGQNAESSKKAYTFYVGDKTKPTATNAIEKPADNEDEVVITVNATDTESGVKRIQLPNGNYVNSAIAVYRVNENGDYTFLIEDNEANANPYTVSVTELATKQKYMVKVIGFFYATTLSVNVPAVSSFIYNSNTEEMDAELINIESSTNAPISMKLKEINVSEESTWQPEMVAPNKYTEYEWRNLTQAQSNSQIALGLQGLVGDGWLSELDNVQIWSTETNNNKIGTIKNQGGIEAQPILKAGTSVSVEQILTANYIYEFELEK